MRSYSKADSTFASLLKSKPFICAILWLLWLVVGTIFYKYNLEIGWGKGLYMAVNIGYSIGWGDIEEKSGGSKLFSIVYVIIGASFVGAALAFFASGIVADKDSWYVNELQRVEYEDYAEDYADNPLKIVWNFVKYYKEKCRVVGLFLCFCVSGTIGSYMAVAEFDLIDAVYFSIASLSTGGHQSLPENRTEFEYVMTALFCAFGIPVMGAAMAVIASTFVDTGGDINEAIEQIKAPISLTEIDMLTEFGLANNDRVLDKSEFMVLCLVRTGEPANPELIHLINYYFDELDKDRSGTLSMKELGHVEKFPEAKISGRDMVKAAQLGRRGTIALSRVDEELVKAKIKCTLLNPNKVAQDPEALPDMRQNIESIEEGNEESSLQLMGGMDQARAAEASSGNEIV